MLSGRVPLRFVTCNTRPVGREVLLMRSSLRTRHIFRAISQSTVYRNSSEGSSRPIDLYRQRVEAGILTEDHAQIACIREMERLHDELAQHEEAVRRYHAELKEWSAKVLERLEAERQEEERRNETLLGRIGLRIQKRLQKRPFQRQDNDTAPMRKFNVTDSHVDEGTVDAQGNSEQHSESPTNESNAARMDPQEMSRSPYADLPLPKAPQPPRGIYLHGDVGVGKSMLMDMLFKCSDECMSSHAPLDKVAAGHTRRRRVHYHSFMIRLHEGMHRYAGMDDAKRAALGVADPLTAVVKELLALETSRFGQSEGSTAAYGEGATVNEGNDALFQVPDAPEAVATVVAASRDPNIASEPQYHDTTALTEVCGLLCFDEFQMNDVADAVILSGVLKRLFRMGVCVVFTSNRPPEALNRSTLHKKDFEAFLKQMRGAVRVMELKGAQDYRLRHTTENELGSNFSEKPDAVFDAVSGAPEHSTFLTPCTVENDARLDAMFHDIARKTPRGVPCPIDLPLRFNRALHCPHTAGRAASFTFTELCMYPRSAVDYVAIAERFDVVFVRDIPQMSLQVRDAARRFITFIDELYNHQVRLVCTAHVPANKLFLGVSELHGESAGTFDAEAAESLQYEGAMMKAGQGAASVRDLGSTLYTGEDETFAFRRAVSRLIEMQSVNYWHQSLSLRREA